MLTVFLCGAVAFAQDSVSEGMIWNWAVSSPVTYHAESMVKTPTGFRFLGESNYEARSIRTELVFDAACVGEAQGRGWRVKCTLENVAMGGEAFAGEQ
ncbi:MAG: hypothetical protein QGG40_11690, partial [Myxococcota bacterium]|nr:hypothetical protein [Myxococcota bacterium]